MKVKFLLWSSPFILALFLISCNPGSKKEVGTSQRVEVQKHGVILDAKYDPRLDNLIPGYKILHVALTNRGIGVLRLNPLKDRWFIVDAFGQKKRAITSLRIKDPGTFGRLPGKLQQMIEYPVGVSVGYTDTIDLFFPASQELNAFRSISYYNASHKRTYDVMSNMDSPTHQPVTRTPAEQAAVADPRFQEKPRFQQDVR